MRLPACLLAAVVLVAGVPAAADDWPSLLEPPRVGGGEADAALIVAVQSYDELAPIPGAWANAQAWYQFFVRARGRRATG